MAREVEKTDEHWRQHLTPEQYRVTREKGTEAPFSGEHYATKDEGKYHCICCGAELFTSETKYESGCGWPSFFAPSDHESIEIQVDASHGMVRDEIMCQRCGAHLGHVFPDGPPQTGQRYCVNSASLKFQPKSDKD